ncbi:MAG TPA: Maf family protein [Candidatus Acidoferrales bacterium]|jgi:predicted house-cleaning NTP pyrophosphatase (Maf/HAM1 superfamily)|nr:Maf family protein [Candidatus Acidoferrales bacterium]
MRRRLRELKLTGLVAIRLPDGAIRQALEATQVTFAPLSSEEIEDYVASGEPFDKAGACFKLSFDAAKILSARLL